MGHPVVLLVPQDPIILLQSFTSEFIYAEPLEVFPDSDEEICDVTDDPGITSFFTHIK